MPTPEELFQQNQKLAGDIAKQYASKNLNADDIRQEALLALWNAALKYDPTRGPFEPYATYLVKAALNKYRKKELNYSRGILDGEDTDDIFSDTPTQEELLLAKELLATLPQPARLIWQMKQEGRSGKEIAKATGLSGRRIYQILTACKELIRRALDE